MGNRNVYIICFILVAASLLWANRTKETWVLYLFVIAFGLAYGGGSASQSPLVATFFGLKSHGLIMGTVNNGCTIGTTIAPLATGYLFDLTGSYRVAFLVVAAIAVIGLALTIALKPRCPRNEM
jgi:MFS family permease